MYISIDQVTAEDPNDQINIPLEILHQQHPSGMPPHILKLKIGCIIMLIRNLNPQQGLLNGTRLIVTGLYKHCPLAQIITGSNKGEVVCIYRLNMDSMPNNLPFNMRRRQFPVILAFALTINKSQGQSFNRVGIFLPDDVFSHGQLYVALSRCRNPDNIKVLVNKDDQPDPANTFTRNVVIQELLN